MGKLAVFGALTLLRKAVEDVLNVIWIFGSDLPVINQALSKQWLSKQGLPSH